MAEFQIIPASETDAWTKILHRCAAYDVFHLPGLHRLAQRIEGGTAYMIAYQEHGHCAALPILVRPVSEVAGLEHCELSDATSIYGYSGPIANVCEDDIDAAEFRHRFQDALRNAADQLNLISVVIRTHPLLPHTWLLDGWADIHTAGPIVAIDLTEPAEVQERNYSTRVRKDLRKSIRRGINVVEAPFHESIDDFMAIYNETMIRTHARPYYFFPREYYHSLRQVLGDSVRFYFAEIAGTRVSAALVFMLNGCIHYHLAGTPTWALHYSGVKAIVDHLRRWGNDNGYRWFNLGGGVNSSHDSLLEFKLGFTKQTSDFRLAKVITNPETYAELNRIRNEYKKRQGLTTSAANYFPEYRQPCDENQRALHPEIPTQSTRDSFAASGNQVG